MFNPDTAVAAVTPKDVYGQSVTDAIAYISKAGYEIVGFRNVTESSKDIYFSLTWNIFSVGDTAVNGPRFILKKKEAWRSLTHTVTADEVYRGVTLDFPDTYEIDDFRVPRYGDTIVSDVDGTNLIIYGGLWSTPRLILKKKKS